MNPTFFPTPSAFRQWLETNHDQASELLVGFFKAASGQASITWPESVDQALCFGWIDGVRKRIDDKSYSIRFTPRRAKSTWSAVNIKRATELEALGLMTAAGMEAFVRREEKNSRIYAYENALKELDPADEKVFRANSDAWKFFGDQAPWYRRVAIHWVTSAKKEETRTRRLATLIDDSANARRIGTVPAK